MRRHSNDLNSEKQEFIIVNINININMRVVLWRICFTFRWRASFVHRCISKGIAKWFVAKGLWHLCVARSLLCSVCCICFYELKTFKAYLSAGMQWPVKCCYISSFCVWINIPALHSTKRVSFSKSQFIVWFCIIYYSYRILWSLSQKWTIPSRSLCWIHFDE